MKNPNGYGSVFELSGNRRKPWAVRVTTGWNDDGKQQYAYLGYYETRRKAMLALADYNKNPYDIDARKLTFADIYDLFYKEKFNPEQNNPPSKQTLVSYEAAFKNCDTLHDKIFYDIKTMHLQDVIDNSELGRSSKNNIKTLYNQMYAFAIKNDIVEKDYSRYVKVNEKIKDTPRTPFTIEEEEIIWKDKDNLVAESILIMIYTGLRIGELLSINKSEVNLEERFLTGGLKTDAGKNRIVPLNKKIIPIIEKRINNKDKYLFANSTGTRLHYQTLMYHWRKKMEEWGMDHTPHDCRHTFATKMNNAGANHVSVKRIMGHSTRDITEGVYTHKDLDELLTAIDLI